MGRKASTINLSEDERLYLETQMRARTIQAQTVIRARILLLKAEGISVDHIADKVGMNRAEIAPHAHGGRHDAGVDHQPRPLYKPCAVQKLVGRDGHERTHDQ